MPTISPFKLRQTVRYLDQDGVIAYPTEAVYGLGCNPLSRTAVMELLRLKQRPVEKGLILIAADLRQLDQYIETNDEILERTAPTWPGPVTWVMPVRPGVPKWLTGSHDSLAVRVTAHPLAKALCEACGGAIVSTSANPSTRPPARTAEQVAKYFHGERLLLLRGDTGGLASATPIYNALDLGKIR